MNFIQILKRIFPQPPTLEEFIAIHNPQDIHAVEHLERQYQKMVQNSDFYT